MEVFYIGKYREPSVSYRGETFAQGQPADVSAAWYEEHKSERLTLADGEPKAPKAKKTPKAPKSPKVPKQPKAEEPEKEAVTPEAQDGDHD